MSHGAFIFSQDLQLIEHISSYLTDKCDCKPCVAQDCETARSCIDRMPHPTIFLDLRAESNALQVQPLLHHLAANATDRINLFTISNGFIPKEVVVPIDQLCAGHFEHPIVNKQMDESLAFLRNGGVSHEAPQPPEMRIAEAGGIKFVTYTPELFPVIDQLVRIAVHNVTLLLVGETGTGKTTLAQLIHRLSERHDEPFQNVSCGALPRGLIESELFGHLRGAFTAAERSKIGRFEAAGRGTLLLDEIDVLGPKEQAKLLRVIETGEFEPVGSTETRYSNARLVVASNVDLETLTENNDFRSDLYYRLNVLEFRLLQLRERPRDIVPMAVDFIDDCCKQHGVDIQRIHHDFVKVLKSYHWPGNIRELKNQIQRSVLFCENRELTVNDLSLKIREATRNGVKGGPTHQPQTLADRVAFSEREILEEALRAHGYKRTVTAKTLGISRVGLYKKMRKLGMLEASAQEVKPGSKQPIPPHCSVKSPPFRRGNLGG